MSYGLKLQTLRSQTDIFILNHSKRATVTLSVYNSPFYQQEVFFFSTISQSVVYKANIEVLKRNQTFQTSFAFRDMALTMEGLAKALNAKIKPKIDRNKDMKKEKKNAKIKRNVAEVSAASIADLEIDRKRKRREREKKKRQKRKKKAQIKAQGSPSVTLSIGAHSSKPDVQKKRTVSIALPGSIVDNCQSRELQSYVAGVSMSFLLICLLRANVLIFNCVNLNVSKATISKTIFSFGKFDNFILL